MFELLIPAIMGVAAIVIARQLKSSSPTTAAASLPTSAESRSEEDTAAVSSAGVGVGTALAAGTGVGVAVGLVSLFTGIAEARRGARDAFKTIFPFMSSEEQRLWMERKFRAIDAGSNPFKIGAHTDLEEFESSMLDKYIGLDEQSLSNILEENVKGAWPSVTQEASWIPRKPEPSELETERAVEELSSYERLASTFDVPFLRSTFTRAVGNVGDVRSAILANNGAQSIVDLSEMLGLSTRAFEESSSSSDLPFFTRIT